MAKQTPVPDSLIFTNVSVDTLLEPFKELIRRELEAHSLKNEEEEQLISRDEARNIFKPSVSKVTLIKWERLGLLISYRIGGRVYYKRSEVILGAQQIQRYGRRNFQALDNSNAIDNTARKLSISLKGKEDE